MLSWIHKYQQPLMLSSLLIYLLIALFDRGGIHYPALLLLSVSVLPFVGIEYADSKARTSSLPPWLLGTAWLFLSFFILSYLFAETRTFGLTSLVTYTSGSLILLLLSSVSFSNIAVSRFLKALIVLGALASLVGLVVFFTEPFNRLAAPFRNSAEAFSFFPNAMADFLLLIIPIGAWASIRAYKSERILWIGSSVLMLTAFFLTFSRGSYIALLGGWGVFILLQSLRYRSKGFQNIVVSGLVILLSFGVSLGVGEYRAQLFEDSTINTTSATDKIALEANEGTSSISERVDFWKGSLLLIPQRPWFGAGAESFRHLYPQVQTEMLALSDHPHNVLLKLAVEHGLIPTVLFVVFLLGFLFVFAQRSSFLSDEQYTLSALMLSGCLALFAHNLIDYNLQFTSVSVLFWILLGLTSSQWRSHGKQSSLSAIPVVVLAAGLFLLGIWEGYHTFEFRRGTGALKAEQYEQALSHFENAESIVFPRNLYIDTAIASHQLFLETGDEEWQTNAQSAVNHHLTLNPHDAFAWYLLSEYSDDDSRTVANALRNALRLDPLNNLEYYAALFEYWNRSSLSTPPEQQIQEIDELLDVYLQKLQVNAHHTILTKNPPASITLCEELEAYRNIEDERCDVLEEVYALEVQKFEEAYGAIESIY